MEKTGGIPINVRSPDGVLRTLVLAGRGGDSLADLLREAGFALNTRCGQRALCNGCIVEMTCRDGVAARTVRACQCSAEAARGATVRIPARSLQRHAPQIVTEFRIDVPVGQDPLCGAEDGTVAAAIDVGTTTVVVLLVDPTDGRILATEAALNQQVNYGEDVLSRIDWCSRDASMVRRLRDAVVQETLAPLLKRACARAGVTPGQMNCATVAGNTTMLHLLARIDPTPMGTAPFTPVFLEHRVLSEGEFEGTGIGGPVHLLPGCAAYVGADVAAGVFASGLLYDDRPSLLVDLGTNGEIVLQHRGRLYACATAAGPAFEGVGLECGMRAGAGAISHLRIISTSPLKIEHELIGAGVDRSPTGICGSGYIDFLAEGRRSGLLTETGRFDTGVRQVLADRDGRTVTVSDDAEDSPVIIRERDVARLLQAKAAIAAGTLILLKRLGLRPSDLGRVCLAGGFGMHVDVANAIRCGLLPGFGPKQVQVIGNSSLAGAYLSLLDRSVIEELEQIRQQVEVVELNQDPEFEAFYIDELLLP